MPSASRIDVAAYFDRIGLRGPVTPTLETLHAIAAAHVVAMPFNNLDILLGAPVSLEPSALERKLLIEGRGGYCFEQNGLLLNVLRQIGFAVTPLGGRVRLETPRPVVPPRTHLFLKVDVDNEPWLVDVGLGRLAMSSAIRLEPGRAQATQHEPRRIVEEDGRLFNQAHLNGAWSDAYEFTLDEMHPIDQEIANWWTSAHPQSRFRNNLLVARAGPSGSRLTINNNWFAIRDASGTARGEELRSPAHLLAILDQHFGLLYPRGTVFRWPGSPW